MKDAIHPTYFKEAHVTCAGCSRTFTVGSTVEKINVELCSNCHPFYTGKQKLVDTAGRVDRFRERVAKAKKSDPGKQQPKDEPSVSEEPTPETRLAEMKKSLESSSDQ